jgi:hypothetical protein
MEPDGGRCSDSYEPNRTTWGLIFDIQDPSQSSFGAKLKIKDLTPLATLIVLRRDGQLKPLVRRCWGISLVRNAPPSIEPL